MIGPIIWILVPVMILRVILGAVKSNVPKRPTLFEVPRDPNERLIVQIKKAAKTNKIKTRQALTITGDMVRDGKRTGWIMGGVVPETNEYMFVVRLTWWKIWQKPNLYIVEPEFCSDLFGREVTVTGRAWYKNGDYFYVIPIVEKSKEIEELWERRTRNHQIRMMRLMGTDVVGDMAFNTILAMRGNFSQVERDLKKVGHIPTITEDELDDMNTAGGGGYGN